MSHRVQHIQKVIELARIIVFAPSDDSNLDESFEIESLALHEELFDRFLTGRIAGEEIAGPCAARGELLDAIPGFLFSTA